MAEEEPGAEPGIDELRARAVTLERQLAETEERAKARIVHAELKAEAVRAGMIDLDGLKLLDPSGIGLTEAGEVEGAAALMAKLRDAKPWLFGGQSSSSRAAAPPAQKPRQKLATEMTAEEYRAARAELLRRR